jgi:hypothetical protein
MNITTRTALAAGLCGVATALAFPAAAGAAPDPNAEQFVMNFKTVRGVDAPTHVTASGPITGTGTETQTDQDTPDGETVVFTWHFVDGTVTAEANEQYTFTPDYTSCTAKATGVGTWTIVSGTGHYRHAQGSGTFHDAGRFVGERDANGACDPNAEPARSEFTLRGSGTVTIGAQS